MDLTIVAVYTICDDLLISLGHQDDQRAKMSTAEVMTTAIIAARYFGGNQQTACATLKTLGYIPNMLGHSRFNRRLHQVSEHFQTLFHVLAEGFKAENSGISTVLIPSLSSPVITSVFHVHACIKDPIGVAKSQANADISMV